MPKLRILSGEPGYVEREDWEYEQWALAVTKDTEDLRWTTEEEKWREHVRTKYLPPWQADLDDAQLKSLYQKGVMSIYDKLPGVGVLPFTRYSTKGTYLQYRDIATGKFIGYQEARSRLLESIY